MKTYISMDDQLTLRQCSCGGTPEIFINILGTQVYIGCPECGAKLVLAAGNDKYRILAQDIVVAMKRWNSEPETFVHGTSIFHEPLIENQLINQYIKLEDKFISFKNMTFMDDEDRMEKEQTFLRTQKNEIDRLPELHISSNQRIKLIDNAILNSPSSLVREDLKIALGKITLTQKEADRLRRERKNANIA